MAQALPPNTSDILSNYFQEQGVDFNTPEFVPEDRVLTQDQIDSVLGMVNPKSEPLWSSFLSKGTASIPQTPTSIAPKTVQPSTITPEKQTSLETVVPQKQMDFTDNEMKQALAQQKSNLQMDALTRAGIMAGRAIGGVDMYAPMPISSELSNLPVEQLEKQRKAEYDKFTKEKEMADKKEAADPTSQHSISYRNLAKSMLDMQGLPAISKAIDGLSAEQIDKKFPMISNIVTAKMAQDAKKEAAALSSGAKAEAKQEKEDAKNFMQETKLRSELTAFDKETKYTEQVTAANALKSMIASGMKSGTTDISMLYTFMKALDPASVVREGEVLLLQSGDSVFNKYGNLPRRITRGDLLSPQFVGKMMNTLDKLLVARKQAFDQKKTQAAHIAKRYNLDLDSIMLSELGTTTTGEVIGQPTNVVQPQYTEAQEAGIARVMQANKATREQAISALKKASKL